VNTGFDVTALGDRLRGARDGRGLTLDQLASLTGVSKAHLSRLESGDRQPSVGMLFDLATALGTRISTLLGEYITGAPLSTFDPAAPRLSANGLMIASCSGYPDSRAIEALRVTVPADREPSPSVRHHGEEWIYVVRGTLHLEFDGVIHEIPRDASAHFDAERPHRLAPGRGDVELLLVTAEYRAELSSIHH
jgi:transcriptional regulator with XRE-family HTH domain